MQVGDVVRVKKTHSIVGTIDRFAGTPEVVFIKIYDDCGVSYGYAEHELERLDITTGEPPEDKIGEDYRNASDRQARERDRWLAAGNSIQTFKPRTLID